ncbi:MAG: LuxR C-terminal-related transcriptional regulator, partial [Gammaproteobacteria bacterium]|nr:LuxR C-terminal-related transcriptional regulator [Gammaproteobacteria bacterium]
TLNLSEYTVKIHVTAIFRELNVSNRTQAVIVAKQHGLTVGDIVADIEA